LITTKRMDSLTQLESLAKEFAAAVKVLAKYCRNADVHPCLVPAEAPREAHSARQTILANVSKVKNLLDGPVDFLQRLAIQVCLSSLLTQVSVY